MPVSRVVSAPLTAAGDRRRGGWGAQDLLGHHRLVTEGVGKEPQPHLNHLCSVPMEGPAQPLCFPPDLPVPAPSVTTSDTSPWKSAGRWGNWSHCQLEAKQGVRLCGRKELLGHDSGKGRRGDEQG